MKAIKYLTVMLALIGAVAIAISATIYFSDDRVCVLHASSNHVTCTRIL
jgi:hypothetical protein